MSSVTKNSFGADEKLKSSKLIDQLFIEGKTVSNFPLKLIYLPIKSSTSAQIQTGVTVAKKNFKSAVDRNKIKRLLREAYRQNKGIVFNNSEASFAFLILYLGKEIPQFQQLERQMQQLLEKFIKKQS